MISGRRLERLKGGCGSEIFTGRSFSSAQPNSHRRHPDMGAIVLCPGKAAIVHLIVRLLAIDCEREDCHSLTIDGLPAKPGHVFGPRLTQDGAEGRTSANWRNLSIWATGVLIPGFGRQFNTSLGDDRSGGLAEKTHVLTGGIESKIRMAHMRPSPILGPI